VNLQSNDFELFGLTPAFAQDCAFLDARWKDLQREVHPDKFAAQGAAAQRLSMQWSVRINEAYQRLKDPLKRAAYLCELNGSPVNAENNTAMPAAFLMQQMEWREALDEASTASKLAVLNQEVREARGGTLEHCAALIDDKKDYLQAVAQVRALMFIDRFSRDIVARLDQLDTIDRGQ
jgi:molecular chaperone HscB